MEINNDNNHNIIIENNVFKSMAIYYDFSDEDGITRTKKSKKNIKNGTQIKTIKPKEEQENDIKNICKTFVEKNENNLYDLFDYVFLSNKNVSYKALKKLSDSILQKIGKKRNNNNNKNMDYKTKIKCYIELLKSRSFFKGKKCITINSNLIKENKYARIVWTNFRMARYIHKHAQHKSEMKTIHGKILTSANKTYYKRVYMLINKFYLMTYYPYSTLYNLIKDNGSFNEILNSCEEAKNLNFDELKIDLNKKSLNIYV